MCIIWFWLQGWVKSLRQHKDIIFLNINDGSCLSSIQVVAKYGSCPGCVCILHWTASTKTMLKILQSAVYSFTQSHHDVVTTSRMFAEPVVLCTLAQWLNVRAVDSPLREPGIESWLREPGIESCATVLNLGQVFSFYIALVHSAVWFSSCGGYLYKQP